MKKHFLFYLKCCLSPCFCLFFAITLQAQLKAGDAIHNAKTIDADILGTFSGGAAVITKGSSTALIDAKGNYIVPYNKYLFQSEAVRLHGHAVIQNGIYRFQNADYSAGGFMNAKGKIIEQGHKHNFSQNQRMLEGPVNNQWSYITEEGKKYVYPVQFFEIGEDIGTLHKENGKWAYRRLSGEQLTDFIFDEAQSFSEGMAIVGKRNEFGEIKYGFINQAGSLVIPFTYSSKPTPFLGGFSKVEPKDKSAFEYAFINKKGEVVYKATPESITQYGRFQPFTNAGLSFNARYVLDSTMKITSMKDFFASFGVSGRIMPLLDQSWVEGDPNPKIFFMIDDIRSPYTGRHQVGYISLGTRKVVMPTFEVISQNRIFFDPVSRLAYAKVCIGSGNAGPIYREGYINEDGLFVLIKGEQSKW